MTLWEELLAAGAAGFGLALVLVAVGLALLARNRDRLLAWWLARWQEKARRELLKSE